MKMLDERSSFKCMQKMKTENETKSYGNTPNQIAEIIHCCSLIFTFIVLTGSARSCHYFSDAR